MADTNHHDLGYGHFGEASYDSHDRKWAWQRSLDSSFHFCPLGKPQEVIPSPLQDHAGSGNPRLKANAAVFSKDVPELVPAKSILPPLALVSSAVLEGTNLHDPLVGHQIAIGTIRDQRIHKRVPVAAFVSDEAKKTLCISRVHHERQGWADDRRTFITVPKIEGERAFWTSPSPIRQITFCRDIVPHKGVLAVRTALGAYMLRVTIDDGNQRADGHSARFNINFRDFSSSNELAICHSDVTINHWQPDNFATIDNIGQWEIWHTASDWPMYDADTRTPLSSGQVMDEERDVSQPRQDTHYDGWARISWIHDNSTIVACTRTAIIAADVNSGKSANLAIEKDRHDSSVWILDMQLHPSQLDCLFFLTPTHVYLVQLKVDTGSKRRFDPHVKVLAKLRHFRDSLDPSLQLSLSEHPSGTLAVMVSTISPSLSGAMFDVTAQLGAPPCTVTPLTLIPNDRVASKQDLEMVVLQPAMWQVRGQAEYSTGLGEGYRRQGIYFCVLTKYHKDFSIFQQILAIRSGGTISEDDVLPTQWRSKTKYTPKYAKKSTFVVPDDEDLEDLEDDAAIVETVEPALVAKKKSSYKRTFNLEKVYQSLLEPARSHDNDVTALLARCEEQIQRGEFSCHQLLVDFGDPSLQVGDLDEATSAFDGLCKSDASTISLLAEPKLLHIQESESGESHMRSIYNGIISAWLSPLPSEVPGRVRLVREQLARRVAAQVSLASYTIKPAVQLDQQPSSPPPVLPSSQLLSSQSTPSVPTSTSLSAVLSRLSRLTPINPPASTPTSLTTTTTSILNHWLPSTSPETYNWTAVRAAQRAQQDHHTAVSQLSDRDRLRREKKAARLHARREREAARIRVDSSQASRAPGVLFSSQSQSLDGELALRSVDVRTSGEESQGRSEERRTREGPGPSSSQIVLPVGVSSQRPAATAPARKKVKRMQGF